MSGVLPKGWTSAKVGDLFTDCGGGTPNRSNSAFWGGTIPWLSSGDIKKPEIEEASETITQLGLAGSAARLCRKGSVVVVVRSGILKHTLPVAILMKDAAINQDQLITDGGTRLEGNALKLCTFKVAETLRGRKIGELFLKAAFTYATTNHLTNIFITARQGEHPRLVEMLEDFGFSWAGPSKEDDVFVKAHPVLAPSIELLPLDYARRFFPHVMDGHDIGKYVIPIQSQYHQILFPDFKLRGTHDALPGLALAPDNPAGNAIKLAYLCHAKIKGPIPGDLALFYRSKDQHRITTLGVVEACETCTDPDVIARMVRRRTVYSMDEIKAMTDRPVKVILFRAVRHFQNPPTLPEMTRLGILNGAPQTVVKISHPAYEKLRELACV